MRRKMVVNHKLVIGAEEAKTIESPIKEVTMLQLMKESINDTESLWHWTVSSELHRNLIFYRFIH